MSTLFSLSFLPLPIYKVVQRGASGFGLGLNYVFRVAEAHGGKVCVESIEGEYSEFLLFLPSEERV